MSFYYKKCGRKVAIPGSPGEHHCSIREADLVFGAPVNRFQEWLRIHTCPSFYCNFSTPVCSLLKTSVHFTALIWMYFTACKHCILPVFYTELYLSYTLGIDKSCTCSFILNTGSRDRLKLLIIPVMRMAASFSLMGKTTLRDWAQGPGPWLILNPSP